MPVNTQKCLDVAVDHRIQRLLRPVPVPENSGQPSDHVSHIESRGRELNRQREEIEVTARLAGPAVTGGIAITLQQPRGNHPFEEGIDQVIKDCETLKAVADVFSVASCGSLNIEDHIAVVDLLPFVPDKIDGMSHASLRSSAQPSVQAICDKQPSVLVCAGRIWKDQTGCQKGDEKKLECIGVGKTFGDRKLPVVARIRHGNKGLIAIPRVNGFHPSYVMNHHPHVSILRQLLILVGAEACGTVRGDWENEVWMDQLRENAKETSKELSKLAPGSETSKVWQKRYSGSLLLVREELVKLLSTSEATTGGSNAWYAELLRSKLSEKCNNASLTLGKLIRLERKGWENDAAMQKAAADTLNLANGPLPRCQFSSKAKLREVVKEVFSTIKKRVTVEESNEGGHHKFVDICAVRNDFLTLAVEIESLLLTLQKQKEEQAKSEADVLSGLLKDMKLNPATVNVVGGDGVTVNLGSNKVRLVSRVEP